MSLIEKAVERLDQLKQAGVTLPDDPAPAAQAPVVAARQAVPDVAEAVAQAATPPLTSAAPAVEPSAVAPRAVTEIDVARLAALGLVSPEQPNSPIAEQYRIIKRPLLRNVQGRGAAPLANANLVMITSSLPGEGKSFSAINLALSIAMELDHTVLLVDADVSKPSVLNTLGLPPSSGLMDVLLGQASSVGDVILRTSIEKLSVLPAGMPHRRATELLASDSMNRLLDEMATRYSDRIIIFDSPPLLVTTEARALATHMGQVVMVVESERTTQAMVRQALSTIEACPVKLMLLNKTDMASNTGHYGVYGYGYGYGYGQTREASHA
ncbi:XrtA-associated tyrosine autokinase [Niveibacterium sp. SC-1]|uniref:XrtA-associated tyrosine autokinase n=1 Tax=Niveibacterium sp. SC-1 TaxID=3135646 RepID=UPI00311DEC41